MAYFVFESDNSYSQSRCWLRFLTDISSNERPGEYLVFNRALSMNSTVTVYIAVGEC